MWKIKIVITFLITFLLCGIIGFFTVQNRVNTEKEQIERLILEHSNRLNDVISKQLYKTQALAALVIRGDGTVDNFQKTAAVFAQDVPTLANFLLAPDGVVTDVYPLEGNEAVLGLDFFNEAGHAGNIEAIQARDSGELVMAGPFMLRQGIMGLTGRYPVYIDTDTEGRVFWGLVSVSLKFPEALDGTGLTMLDNRDVSYELWRINPDTLEEQVIAGNSDLHNTNTVYLERLVNIHNAQWYFRIYMTTSWYEYPETWSSLLLALSISFFVAFIMQSKRTADEKAARVQDAIQVKSKFFAFMSHEMRTPMNSIIGISGIEMENDALPTDVHDAFGRINNSGRTLLGIINDILDLSKVETGNLEITPVKYDVAGLIKDTSLLNVMLIGDKQIKFVVNAAETIPAILIGDDLRIRQILNNILSNSIKYTDKGEVAFGIDTKSNENNENNANNDSSENSVDLIFTVKDTGRGMTQEQLAALYDEYTMFGKDVDRQTEGTGLGMSITKKLLEIMNGSIDVESTPGAGTIFTVHLPQKLVDEVPIGKELAGSLNDFDYSPRRNKKKLIRENMSDCCILIVDDIEENLFVAKGLMKPYGLQIDTASNGYEALEKIQAGKTYDIIFMDHMMPGMDGIETTEILRAEGYTHPIVALTANVVAGIEETFIESGFDDFIPKPFDEIRLDNILRKYNRKNQTTISPLISRLKENSHLNVDTALNALGGMDDVYTDTVKITARMMTERIENIDRYISSDLESFKVEIHGIKSVLVNIGAHTLSVGAAQLEHAAIENDTSYLNENYPAFKTELTELSEELKEAIKDSETGETAEAGETAGKGGTADKTLLPKIISEVKAATEEYDSMLALEILSKSTDLSYDTETDELLKKIDFSLEKADYENALKNITVMEDLLNG